MKFYNSRTNTDCLAAGIEFLIQKPREKIEKLLSWRELDQGDGCHGLFCLWSSPVFRNKIEFSKKDPGLKNKLLIIGWDKHPNVSHVLLHRGKKIYDPFQKKAFKSFQKYQLTNNNPKILGFAFIK